MWLNRLGLSSRLAEYSSLLRTISPSSNCSSVTAQSSASYVSVGASDVVGVLSQELTTCRSFVLRPLPQVGLNTVMSIKRSVSASPHSVTHRSLLNENRPVPCISISPSATQCHSGNCVADSKLVSEMCACSSTAVVFSSSLLKSASVPFANVTPEPDSLFLSTVAATTEASCSCSGHFLPAVSTEAPSELLKFSTRPSVVLVSDISSVVVSTSAAVFETNCEHVVSATSPISTCSAVGQTSTAAKRPQSLDVIPWGCLSRSACTLTGSVSTVVHSRVTTSSSSISAATEVVPASSVDIPAVWSSCPQCSVH